MNLVADNNNVSGRIYSGWVSISGPVTSLQGLQNCKNIVTLYLESNAITDLSPLEPLATSGNLVFLDLDYNNTLSDLSPLSGITSLQGLEIRSGTAKGDVFSAGGVTSLGPVSTLTNLTELEFSAQPVTSLAPLATLVNLQNLFMYGDGSTLENSGFIGGVTVLSKLTNLQLLDAGNRGITDISSATGLIQLETADLSNNPISDISPISGWTSAQDVIFEYDSLSGAIPSLPGFGTASIPVTLDLSNNAITSISNLSSTPVPGLEAAGSLLNISSNNVPPAQVTAIQTPYPKLTVTYP